MKETVINSVLQSRGVMVLFAIIAFVLSFYEWELISFPKECVASGLLGDFYIPQFFDGTPGIILNYIGLVLIGVLMLMLNKQYLFLGNMSSLFVSLFLIFEMAIPAVGIQFCYCTYVVLILMFLIIKLFSTYNNTENHIGVFLIFATLSTLATIEISAIYAMPLFVIGLWQFRSISLRSGVAAILGILTPYWIILGLNIYPFDSLEFPTPTPIWELDSLPYWLPSSIFVLFTAIVSLAMNFFTLMKYKLRTRMYNSFIIFTLLWSIIMIIIDCSNAAVYVTILMACASMQISHLYSVSSAKRRYIPLFLLIALSIGIIISHMI
ncbi:MAG: hypothetical protein J1F10_00535 [Muribaculaceae bacterium]|nr:hypothetical protein [Muribaculaceae bacterium]